MFQVRDFMRLYCDWRLEENQFLLNHAMPYGCLRRGVSRPLPPAPEQTIFVLASAVRAALPLLALLLAFPAAAQDPGIHRIGVAAVEPMSGAFLGLNCNHLEVQGELWLGSGEIDQAHDVDISGVLTVGSGLIDVGGNWNNSGTFIAGTGTVRLSGSCANALVIVEGPTTFCNLELSGSGVEYRFPPGSRIVVECELNLGDDNELSSSGPGEARIVLGARATISGDARLSGVLISASLPPVAIPSLGPVALAGLMLLLIVATATRSLGRHDRVRSKAHIPTGRRHS